MDCFYAQVEMRDNPKLKNLPLAVGGLPGTRSVLCTSNYEARKFGVKSAMPTDFAIRLCPQLKVIEPNFEKYELASKQIHEIFSEYTKKIEPLSLDEAYLDVSDEYRASIIAKRIKEDILKKTGLTASVGLAPNKFLSKIASDWKKPNGYFVILPDQIEHFVKELLVQNIPGVGKKTLEILHSLNIKTCKDLQLIDKKIIFELLGKFGLELIDYAYGKDDREVITDFERKSVSVEETFLNDLSDPQDIETKFKEIYDNFYDQIVGYSNHNDEKKIKKIFVKVKFNDFSKVSSETTLSSPIETKIFPNYLDTYLKLLSQNMDKKDLPIRLIGIGVRFQSAAISTECQPQLPFIYYE